MRQHHSEHAGSRSARSNPNPLRGIRKSKKKSAGENKLFKKSSVELITPSDKRFRGRVLASVGLDDDDDENESDDKGEDIEGAGSHHQRDVRSKDRNNRRDNTKINKSADESENIDLLDEEGEVNDNDGHQSNGASTRCSIIKPICHKLLWILATVAAVTFILYDDERLEESETDEEVVQKKKQPYSYNGYKDARIPDDDVAQFGGGLLYGNGIDSGATGALPSTEDEDETTDEINVLQQSSHHHEPTGIVEVDILWGQLEGYAEISEPLNEQDLPVFWHVRE